MQERTCINCGRELQVIKNGFFFIQHGGLRTSDLWGCKGCNRFQIHGIPNSPAIPIFGFVSDPDELSDGLVCDPGNERFWAILDPTITFTDFFRSHLKEWYPDWEVPE